MDPVTIIFNTRAGSGKNQNHLKKVIDFFRQRQIDYRFFETLSIGHAVRLAQQALEENRTHLIVAGGDGTLNEVINGIFTHSSRPNVRLGLLPIGTCNDFANAVGIPPSLDRALEVSVSGVPTGFDVARLHNLYFINIAGTGFDVDIVENIQRNQGGRNFITYLAAVLRIIRQYHSGSYQIKAADVEIEGKMLMISLANGRTFGGGFRVAPMADPRDGLLHVVVLRDMPFLKRVHALLRVLNGSHDKLKETVIFKSNQISLKSDQPLKMQLEGELVRLEQNEISIAITDQIQILVPQQVGKRNDNPSLEV